MTSSSPAPLPSASDLDSPARRRLPPLLRRAWFNMNQAFRRRIAHMSLTPDQFTVIRTLQECDPKGVTQRQLTEIISSDPNTVAALLDRMEKAGMIERKTHEEDRRAHRICLLPQGRERYLAAREVALKLQMEILSALPGEKLERFLEDLAAIADACWVAAKASPKSSGQSTAKPRARKAKA